MSIATIGARPDTDRRWPTCRAATWNLCPAPLRRIRMAAAAQGLTRPPPAAAATKTRMSRNSPQVTGTTFTRAPRAACVMACNTADSSAICGPVRAVRPTHPTAPKASITCSGPASATISRNPQTFPFGYSRKGAARHASCPLRFLRKSKVTSAASQIRTCAISCQRPECPPSLSLAPFPSHPMDQEHGSGKSRASQPSRPRQC